jgi:hypothetical protein
MQSLQSHDFAVFVEYHALYLSYIQPKICGWDTKFDLFVKICQV